MMYIGNSTYKKHETDWIGKLTSQIAYIIPLLD